MRITLDNNAILKSSGRLLASDIESVVTDPDFASVVLLLDFAGADGAQDISDLSNSANNDETFNQVGVLEVDTAQTYLGRNSLLIACKCVSKL